MASLLQIPGEIRNHIYQYALVKSKPFTVKMQFNPHETALFRVNKQIYEEASTIFYHHNIFEFPQALFDSHPILEKLEDFIRLPTWRLATLKNFKIDVPVSLNENKSLFSTGSIHLIKKKLQVYHFDDAPELASAVACNNRDFALFIEHYGSPNLKVQVDVGVAAFLDDSRLKGSDYWNVICPWSLVQNKVLADGGTFEIIMRLHPQCLDQAVMNLVC